ncbi:MAG: sigma 54-interacting transcriptional regulator [Planctomycetota bacterium]|nr:sigma 54-interacting transcriptional regulator [Planctomycetota bacterium]
MPKIVIMTGEDKGASYLVEGNLTMGRSEENDIQLTGHGISRVHARVTKKGARFFIKDTGSKNGVHVNGKRVTESVLRDGDIVQIGNVVMAYSPPFEIHVTQKAKGREKPAARTKSGDAADTRIVPAVGAPGQGQDETIFIFSDRSSTLTPIKESPIAELDDVAKEVEKAETPRELTVALRRLKAVYDVGTAIASILDEQALLNKLLEVLLEVFGAERASILLCSPAGNDVRVGAVKSRGKPAGSFPVSRTVLNQSLLGGKAVISSDARHDPRFDSSKSIKISDVKSILCVPLKARDRLLGAVYLDTQEFLRSFDEEDLTLLVNIARQAAVAIDNARLYTHAREEASLLRKHFQEEYTIVGEAPEMLALKDRIKKAAASDSTVLLMGETGTGKELAARTLHVESARRAKPFVPVDCTAMSETLLESELFGHERGAFTGADRQKPGKFEIANGGTLFLDEIGDMSMSAQAKLLRALEERAFTRVGGVKIVEVDVRVIAASNAPLEELVKKGRFREDLYFRLAVVPIAIPPLREHREDIRVLALRFLQRFAQAGRKNITGFSRRAMDALIDHDWPGNVRELRNVIESIVVLTDKTTIDLEDLPYPICPKSARAMRAAERGTDQYGTTELELLGVGDAIGERTSGRERPAPGEGPAARQSAIEPAGSAADTQPRETAAAPRDNTAPETPSRQLGEVPLSALVSEIERTYVQRALAIANGKKVEAARILGISRPTLDKKIREFGLDVEQ